MRMDMKLPLSPNEFPDISSDVRVWFFSNCFNNGSTIVLLYPSDIVNSFNLKFA